MNEHGAADEGSVVECAECVVLEAQLEAIGTSLDRCECGAAEVEAIPGAEVGFRCAGCKERI